MSNQVNAKAGLSVKDLVTTGIFTALLFVFIMVGGVFFATNPVLTFFMPAGSALLAGPLERHDHGRYHGHYLVCHWYALGVCVGLSHYGCRS